MPDLPTPFQKELQEFLDLLKLCGKSLSGIATTLGTALPLTGFLWQSVAPPWPVASPLIPTLASVFTILILYLTFRVRSEVEARRWSKRMLIASLFLGAVYILLAANYLEEIDGQVHLTGWSLTEEAQQALSNPKGPKNTTRELLNYFGHESEDRIWKGRYSLKWLLLLLACFASMTFAGGVSLLLVATIVSGRVGNAGPAQLEP